MLRVLPRILVVLLIFITAYSSADARRRTPPAGSVKDGVYTDGKYGFQLTMHDNWKPGVNKDKEKARIVLTQSDYDIPLDYINVPHYTWVPTLTVFVDTSMMHPQVFMDSLLHDDFKSDQKKGIEREFEFLSGDDIIPKGRSRWEIAGENGVIWTAQSKYIKIVQTSASSAGGKRVYGSYGGAVAVVEHNDRMYVFLVMCEWQFFKQVMIEVQEMMGSLTFVDSEKSSEE